MRMKHVGTPLTSEELKKKFESGKQAITMPKKAMEADGEIGRRATSADPEFTSVEFGGVFWFSDSIGVDGNGKEHIFHGGAGFRFNWVAKNVGFGEFQLKLRSDGVVEIDSETLGKEFFKKALAFLIDTAKDKSVKAQ